MLYGASYTSVEWTGKTKATSGHSFHWPDCCPGDISESRLIRFSSKGVYNTWIAIALAEEKDHNAKKITYIIGGHGNNFSAVNW